MIRAVPRRLQVPRHKHARPPPFPARASVAPTRANCVQLASAAGPGEALLPSSPGTSELGSSKYVQIVWDQKWVLNYSKYC
jgi:hypothetical protein